MPLTGVAGWPVKHSRSPILHAAAFNALGLNGWESQLLPIPPELFDETVAALEESGFAGINVTIPHKEAALALADEATPQAREIGAANTLTFRDRQIMASNTDSPAILDALQDALPDGRRESALVLGAGGSARAAVHALKQMGIAQISICARGYERAERLAQEIAGTAVKSVMPADVLINCTPVGLDATETDQLKALNLTSDDVAGFSAVCDLVYTSQPTELFACATRAGVSAIDGLEILARQGALSIEIWTGLLPDWKALEKAVRQRG